MNRPSLYKGDTLLISSDTYGDPKKKHLHVVLIDPYSDTADSDAGEILIASISSIRQGGKFYDDTCILNSADHRFIKHDSYVPYRRAGVRGVNDIQNRIENESIVLKEAMEMSVVEKICDGLLRSRHTPENALKLYRKATNQTVISVYRR